MNKLPNFTLGRAKEDISKSAVEFFVEEIREAINIKRKAVIILPAGSSPEIFYELLTATYKNEIQWDKILAFSLDELVNIPEGHPRQFITYIDNILFSKVPIPETNIHFLNGNSKAIEKEIMEFERKLERVGGIDITIIGVGSDGHIGMNFPGTSFSSITRKVLLPSHARLKPEDFQNDEEIPTHGVTIGIATILSSRKIILLADGENKQNAITELVTGKIREKWPVTALRMHPHVNVFIAQDAVSEQVLTHINNIG